MPGSSEVSTGFRTSPKQTYSHHSMKRHLSKLMRPASAGFDHLKPLVVALGLGILPAAFAGAEAGVSILHTFGPRAPDGAFPWSTLVQGADGNLYGTTGSGGPLCAGTVFRSTPSGAVSVLYAFTNGIDGGYPRASLAPASDGSFYGTAAYGGSNGVGTVFKLSTNGVFTPLYSFRTNNIDGNARRPH